MTKEDIRELIYREMLEYHPQLLKDYINGNEGTNFLYPRFEYFLITYVFIINFYVSYLVFFALNSLDYIVGFYCSAIGQFRKQFAYLEENGGRSAPVFPLERKHVSLPRYYRFRTIQFLMY